jgi:hypothetical protein
MRFWNWNWNWRFSFFLLLGVVSWWRSRVVEIDVSGREEVEIEGRWCWLLHICYITHQWMVYASFMRCVCYFVFSLRCWAWIWRWGAVCEGESQLALVLGRLSNPRGCEFKFTPSLESITLRNSEVATISANFLHLHLHLHPQNHISRACYL